MDAKLLEALKTIKKECKKHFSCTDCPMYSRLDDEECIFEIKDPSELKLEPRITYF